jgi:hypothetical protein
MRIVFSVLVMVMLGWSQQIEKQEFVLGPPTHNTNRGDGYGFEIRGNLYPKGTAFDCGSQPAVARAGTYLLKVRYFANCKISADCTKQEMIATWVVRIGSAQEIQAGAGKQLMWEAYTKYEPGDDGQPLSFPYEAAVLRSDQRAMTEFFPVSPECFGGKLSVYYLE